MSKSGYQTARQRAEAKARANGYTGEWPPRQHPRETPEDVIDVLGKVEAGEHRTSYMTMLGDCAFSFFSGLTPDHFRRMARAVLEVVENDKNTVTARMMAAKSVMTPINKAIRLMLKLDLTGQDRLLLHIDKCFRAYAEEIGDNRDRVKAAGVSLVEIAQLARQPHIRVRAATEIMKQLLATLDTFGLLNQAKKVGVIPGADSGRKSIESRKQEAIAKLAEMKARVGGAA